MRARAGFVDVATLNTQVAKQCNRALRLMEDPARYMTKTSNFMMNTKLYLAAYNDSMMTKRWKEDLRRAFG